jgi:hypothetical protein
MPPLIILLFLACAAGAPTPVGEDTPAPQAPPAPPALDSLEPGRFHSLEPGLELGRFASPQPSLLGDERITVLRVDPQRFSVELLSKAREHPDRSLAGPHWLAEHDLVAVINAGMFATDHSTATFGMVDEGLVNNGSLNPRAGSALLLEPTEGGLASARLLDLRCEDLEARRPQYGSLVQSYRLLECDGTPAWQASSKIWSHALVGMDHSGNILFIHARSPWSTRQFTEILLALPLDLDRLHYAEGGPEATLAMWHEGRELTLVGSYETGFNENDRNHQAWAIPNVIGVRRRP